MTVSLYFFLFAMWIQKDANITYGKGGDRAASVMIGLSLSFVLLSAACMLSGH